MAAIFNQNSKKGKNQKNVMSEINVTPFVDVMLVLLVIFMVTSPLLVTGVNVDLPDSESAPITIQEEPLSVTVNAKGEVFIQDSKIELASLAAKLLAITNEKRDTKIFIRGDRDVGYGEIMKVISSINQAGFNKVALLTEPIKQ
jgi:biopolymer transport protein TolR